MPLRDDQFPDTLLKNPEKSHQMMETPMAFAVRGRRSIDEQLMAKVSMDMPNFSFLLFKNDHGFIMSQSPTIHR
jgi:uncharacterized protein YunC (DUF1805 family)